MLRPERHVVFLGHLSAADAVVRMLHNNTPDCVKTPFLEYTGLASH